MDERTGEWELYRTVLREQVLGYARLRARALASPEPAPPGATGPELRFATVVPALAARVRGQAFYLARDPAYRTYLEAHPGFPGTLGIREAQARKILNYVNGQRSVTEIRKQVEAWTGKPLEVEAVAGYLEALVEVGWITR